MPYCSVLLACLVGLWVTSTCLPPPAPRGLAGTWGRPYGRDARRAPESHHRKRHRWHRWVPEWFTHRVRGQGGLGSFSFDFDLDRFFRREHHKPWWKGSNVCVKEEETKTEAKGHGISPHFVLRTSSCEELESAYKCTTSTIYKGRKTTTTVSRECCHGYQREKGKSGCTRKVELKDLMDTARELGAIEFVSAISSLQMDEDLQKGNYTLFVPSDKAFKKLKKPFEKGENNVVEVDPQLLDLADEMEKMISGHIVPGYMRTTQVEDEQLLPTVNVDSKIRINFYSVPKKLTTANCRPMTSTNNMATNGVIHMIDGLLNPVTDTMLNVIQKNPQLSTLKTVLGSHGVGRQLKEEGHMTLFAPTDAAFNRLPPEVRKKLLGRKMCLDRVVKFHLLPHVICSSVVEGQVQTRNEVKQLLNLTRDSAGKMFCNTAQIVQADVLGTNGVIHIIDDLLLPDDALGVDDQLKKAGANETLRLIRQSGLDKELDNLEEVTVIAPTDKAFTELPQVHKDKIERDSGYLRDLLMYHMLPTELLCPGLKTGHQVDTRLTGKKMRIHTYSSHPFGGRWRKTLQCGTLVKQDLKACNGVVHLVDKVLIPPFGDLVSTLAADTKFSELVSLLKTSGLADELGTDTTYTIFAPTNKAFSEADQEVLNRVKQDKEKLKKFLKHHVIKGPLCCAGIFENGWSWLANKHRTLDNSHMSLTRKGDSIKVGSVNIQECDTMATNGIIHTMDTVLPDAMKKYGKREELPQRGSWRHTDKIFDPWSKSETFWPWTDGDIDWDMETGHGIGWGDV